MLPYLSEQLSQIWGPGRLLGSFLVLASVGSIVSAMLSLFLLPKLWYLLTTDKGRDYAVNAEASVGKPLGAGIFIMIFSVLCVFLFTPFNADIYLCMVLLLVASLLGFGDDSKPGGYSELTLGLTDLLLSLGACMIILDSQTNVMWLPFTAVFFEFGYWAAVLIYTPVIWLSINALNCNDGVDGLSGSLSASTLAIMCFVLYTAVGNIENSKYLLLPFNSEGANWAVATAVFIGSIFGYLWHNAPPSAALMGDAGSRPLGLLIGMLIVVAGSPMLIFFVMGLILVNGATGLAKVALIRLFKIQLLGKVRFPLHDHARENLGWSNSQVLIRFLLLHLATMWILLLVLLKIR